jgi:hypothetical protein
MRLIYPVLIVALVASAGGCSPKGSNPSSDQKAAGPRKPFLDQKKEIVPQQEWNREITSKNGGTITFRVESQGPFAVTVVTDRGYKALVGGNSSAIKKEDMLLTIDSKEPTLERDITIPAGSSWFIIRNDMNQKAEIHLQCFAPKT